MNNSKNSKGALIYAIAGVCTLIVAVAGSAYAYYNATATGNFSGNAMGGGGDQTTTAITNGVKVENSTLSFELTKLSTTADTKVMIPISKTTTMLTNAAKGWNGTAVNGSFNANYACIDKFGSAACKTYQLKITNKTTGNLKVNAGVTALTGVTNIDTVKMASNISVSSVTSIKGSATGIASNAEITAGGSSTYYFMVFINDTGVAQTDSGTFTGTVTVGTGTGGITGTFS